MKIRFLNQKFTLSEIWKLRFPILKLLFSYKKMLNLSLICLSKILKRASPMGAPLILMTEASSRCDMTCPMCPVILNATRRPTGDMEFNTFKKVIDEIGDTLLSLALWNYGEPLLNPDLFSMVDYAHKKKILTIVSTNGLSLNVGKSHKLLDSNLDYLIVSFDGATKETYEKFRGKGNFEKVLVNLTSLVKIKKQQQRTLPFIDLQYIVMKENEHEIDDIKVLAGALGVDKLSLKKFTYIGDEEAKPFLSTQEEYLFGKYKGYEHPSGCSRVLDSSVILWDGSVIPCCVDLDFKYSFGSINKNEKFMDIWNSDGYTAFRERALRNAKSIDICNRCPGKNYNLDMFIEQAR